MAIEYTRPESATGVRTTAVPNHGQTVSGYGGAIPTRHMLQYLGVWRRVYVMCFGNAGTPYVKVKGERVILDTDTEHRLRDAA